MAYTRAGKNSDQGGIRTHDLRILFTVAPPAGAQAQNGIRPWVLEELFDGLRGK